MKCFHSCDCTVRTSRFYKKQNNNCANVYERLLINQTCFNSYS